MKNIAFDPFNWIGKSAHGRNPKGSKDVYISLCKRGPQNGDKRNISFTFRNNIDEIFEEHVMIAPHKNRIYFKNDANGYKISKATKSPTLKIGIHIDLLKDFIGEYDLLFDEYWELYYIEKKGEENII